MFANKITRPWVCSLLHIHILIGRYSFYHLCDEHSSSSVNEFNGKSVFEVDPCLFSKQCKCRRRLLFIMSTSLTANIAWFLLCEMSELFLTIRINDRRFRILWKVRNLFTYRNIFYYPFHDLCILQFDVQMHAKTEIHISFEFHNILTIFPAE